MKRFRLLCPVLLILLLLSGCAEGGSGSLDKALEFRTRLLSAEGGTFSARITADYTDRVYTFVTDCQWDKDGSLSFTVTEPETLAGITGMFESGDGKLTFDGTALDFGILADGQVSPVSCTYVMLTAWRTGYISSAGQTEDGLRITFDSGMEEQPLTVDLWLDEAGLPKYGEITYAGRRILSAELENMVLASDPGTD